MHISQESLGTEQITRDLGTRRIGRQVEMLAETTSTNDEALSRADQDGSDGLAIFAERQTSGRGRFGRRWESPHSASVLCSVLLIESARTGETVLGSGVLMLATGVSVRDAVVSVLPDVEPTIKWPNDIVVGGRKLAGILIESRPVRAGRAYAIGVGVNCLQQRGHFQGELRSLATSLEAESRYPVSRLAVARQLLIELDRRLAKRPDTQALRRAWLDRAEPLGRHVRLRQGGHDYAGTTIDVDPTAGLIVELDEGGRRVFDPATTSLLVGGPSQRRGC